MQQQTKEAVQYIQSNISAVPSAGLVLGSGLGVLADEIKNPVVLKYEDIPGFPVSTVEGHAGQLVFGELEGMQVAAMQGRFHYYEGYSLQEVTFPIRVMNALGVKRLLVTNAAGGVNHDFEPGDLMIIDDHINWLGANPLIGENDAELGPRFPDMSSAYSKGLAKIADEAALSLNIRIQRGTYMANTGPAYETPAEVRMARVLGADAVGMSTVPEVIVAVHGGMEVLGISCISNLAAGMLDQPLSHDEVMDTTSKVQEDFLKLMKETLRRIAQEDA
ncbi:purine-nucleoside phosphorylase [Marinococcus sp. PL1-022]|uniref:purine-nucleoside phosphorylase n=1 Tax=Marinococcus sp. PL1-022 TaxID=3095363 RepID=UPI0029C5C240|nr:purine-nucleoside phosphorylase [Marinococcus sp. PL1-022]MDX6153053.1 purine-nucleoside phosphorylase [Marinococcus sp. PL1-022]